MCNGKATHRASQILEYLHSDLWGAAKVPTHGQSRYFLSIVDDYLRKWWIYLLKTIDETFSKFKSWKLLIENQTRKKVRTDNGHEFYIEKFDAYCRTNGILRHRTVRKTPQKNSLVECKNMTLLDKVRYMLYRIELSKLFWGETIMTTAYLINRIPSSIIGFKTLEEL